MKFLKFTPIDRFKKRREKDDPGIIEIEYPRYVYRYLVTQIFQQFHDATFHDETFETSAISKISMYNNRETLFNAPLLSRKTKFTLEKQKREATMGGHNAERVERAERGPRCGSERRGGGGGGEAEKETGAKKGQPAPLLPLPSRSMKTKEKGRRKGPVGGTRTRINLEGTRDEKRDEEKEEEEEENGGGAGFECRCRQDK